MDPDAVVTTKSKEEVNQKSPALQFQQLKEKVLNTPVEGLDTASRAVIAVVEGEDSGDGTTKYKLCVEGTGFGQVLAIYGIDWRRTTTNSILEAFSTLGIEAARSTIIREMKYAT